MKASIKEHLWHAARRDLALYIPEIQANQLLMCCACGRFLKQNDFDLEHLIPQQALADDPAEVKGLLSANLRAGNILLCKKPLKLNGTTVYPLGCNSWKGRSYDKGIREFLNGSALKEGRGRLNVQHTIATVCLAYLAMVREYGYQIALTKSGQLLRRQFFSPFRFLSDMPVRSQMTLAGGSPKFTGENMIFWKEPFSFSIENFICIVRIRSMVVAIPLARDPTIPIARHLLFKPQKYALRPNFDTVFD